MKEIFKKTGQKGSGIYLTNDNKFILQFQNFLGDRFEMGGFLFDSNYKLISQKSIEIGSFGLTVVENILYCYDEYKKAINIVDLNTWEIIKSYQYPSDLNPVQFINSNKIILKDTSSYKVYDFEKNFIIKEIGGEEFLLDFKFWQNKYFIFRDSANHNSIICLNIEKGIKQWEINFNDKNRLKEKCIEFFDFFKLTTPAQNIIIRQFEVFDNKIIVRTNAHILLCICLDTGQIIWVNRDDDHASAHEFLQFSIDKLGTLCVLGNTLEYSLRTIDVNTGSQIWKSKVDWRRQSEITSSYFSEFSMNDKYIFVASINWGQILVIEKSSGSLVERINIFKRPKEIKGVISKPIIFQKALLILIIGELFVYDISEYV